MKPIDHGLILGLALIVLMGCAQVPEVQVQSVPPSGASSEAPLSGQELEPVTGHALGTLGFGSAVNAATSGWAAKLLPLWHIIASGSLNGNIGAGAVK